MTAAEEVEALWSAACHQVNYRTVASRAYYACFNGCMALAIRHGFVPDRTGLDHGRVRDFLRALSSLALANLLHRIATDRLPRLRKLRGHADYNTAIGFPKAQAENAVELMRDILAYLRDVETANRA